jgi:hypothetical protein
MAQLGTRRPSASRFFSTAVTSAILWYNRWLRLGRPNSFTMAATNVVWEGKVLYLLDGALIAPSAMTEIIGCCSTNCGEIQILRMVWVADVYSMAAPFNPQDAT